MSTLGLFPSVGFWVIGNELFLDRKFHDGLILYSMLWGGKLKVFMRQSESSAPKFGLVKHSTNDNFELVNISHRTVNQDDLISVDVALSSADDYRNLHLSKLCMEHNITCIYYLEYILETRLQINWLSDATYYKKLKKFIWIILTEYRRVRALKVASGLQSNGMPVYLTYRNRLPTILYFDTRCTEHMLIDEQLLTKRLNYLKEKKPLRLAFSGRLNKMKGVDDLISFALMLEKQEVEFILDIFGDGELLDDINSLISENDLAEKVTIHGAVDFESVLVPFIKERVDIFICCHKQSDPSCTYLETYSCGVPILGYDNKAHKGILKLADVGWAVPIRDVNGLVEKFVEINNARDEIAQKAKNAIMFAQSNTFMTSFKKRIDNCIEGIKQSDQACSNYRKL